MLNLILIMKPTVDELFNKYSKDKQHAKEVIKLSLIIFDEVCKKFFEMPQIEKEYLKSAALLHDIGYYIEAKSHNKHSMEMIIKDGLQGFDEREAKIIGCIARYHRGSLPDKHEHEIYGLLDKKDRKMVKRLGGILKLSDGLCKDHENTFSNIELTYDEKHDIITFMLYPKNSANKPDIKTAIRKRDLFEIGFKCQSVLIFNE